MTRRVHRYVRLAAAQRGVTVADVFGNSRLRPVARARRLVMRRLYAEGYSLSQIGRWLNRDHSTVSHAIDVGGRPEQRVRVKPMPSLSVAEAPKAQSLVAARAPRDSIAYNRQIELAKARNGCRELLRAHLTVPRSHWINDPMVLAAARQTAGLPA